jgi:FG-GAP repeat/Thrombospondin type 3 repeat
MNANRLESRRHRLQAVHPGRPALTAAQSVAAIVLISLTLPVVAFTLLQEQKLVASDGQFLDLLGGISAISGDTIALYAVDDDRGTNAGAVYIFRRSGALWSEEAKLTASDGEFSDFFGRSIAIDGETLVVGAPGDNDGALDSGSVYVYTRSGSNWNLRTKLVANDPAVNEGFGSSIALRDGTLAVGSASCSGAPAPTCSSGSVYMFTGSGSSWTQTSKLTAFDATVNDHFGVSLDLSGSNLIVGAHFDDDTGLNSGSAYIFTRSGGIWSQQAKLLASDGLAQNVFGLSVAIDEKIAIVGARSGDGREVDSGAAYVYEHESGVWSLRSKLVANDGSSGDSFGHRVLFGGEHLLVSAPGDDDQGSGSGSVYVFRLKDGAWIENSKFAANDTVADDQFGASLALQGNTLVVGANGDDDLAPSAGSAYVFNVLQDTDADDDGVADVDDNCPSTENPDQSDSDLDGNGDSCDVDDDDDGRLDDMDNCPLSVGQSDDQTDGDGDGVGDVCDTDQDGDGVANEGDNCPVEPNDSQSDIDSDGYGDACDADDDNDAICDLGSSGAGCAGGPDNCPSIVNPDQLDTPDSDGIGNSCDIDDDGDGVNDGADNCPILANQDQSNSDFDEEGDVCDIDDDNDQLPDDRDNCPLMENVDQADTDADGVGDACNDTSDRDADNWRDDLDNCPEVANTSQTDQDGDSIGDACDLDADGDGVVNESDSCPVTASGEIVHPGNGCSLDQLAPCGGPRGTDVPWQNHGAYQAAIAHAVKMLRDSGVIDQKYGQEWMRRAAQSSCGSSP